MPSANEDGKETEDSEKIKEFNKCETHKLYPSQRGEKQISEEEEEKETTF